MGSITVHISALGDTIEPEQRARAMHAPLPPGLAPSLQRFSQTHHWNDQQQGAMVIDVPEDHHRHVSGEPEDPQLVCSHPAAVGGLILLALEPLLLHCHVAQRGMWWPVR